MGARKFIDEKQQFLISHEQISIAILSKVSQNFGSVGFFLSLCTRFVFWDFRRLGSGVMYYVQY